jgi:hypothetical protein
MSLAHWLATATPTPLPYDPETITPGWIGFVIIFALAAITVVLILDMTRRIRRVRYRAEVAEKLDAETGEADRDQP